MTTTDPTSTETPLSSEARPTRHSGHIGRITAVTTASGAIAAVVLAAVVLRGAPEPVITGAVLLAFAASWAALAVLSDRRTDQPQRWARTPAAAMAALGAASLALRPSDAQMRLAGWVWPLGLIALAVWMTARSRRSLRSWARRAVLYPIFGLMVVGGLAATVETVRASREPVADAAPGDLVDVGGHRLHIDCTGTGSPTVVLEAGLGEPSTAMAAWIAPGVAPTTRVCVYDRAGKGWSDPAPEDADPLAVVTDLHTLLDRHGETGPFVLGGHSSGGVYVQAYAATYPDDVAGLVLLDSQPTTALTELPGYAADYEALRAASGLAPTAARFGLMRLVATSTGGSLPEPQRTQGWAFGATAGQARSLRDEVAALPAVMERARALTSVGGSPVAIVTAEQDAMDGWLPLQTALTRLSTDAHQTVVPDATHVSLVEDEHDAASATRAIVEVVRSVRADAPAHAPAGAPAVPGEASRSTARPTGPVDTLVPVDGARLHVRCTGSGPVTVVLVAGFEASGDTWSAVAPTVDQEARVCTYDRYGTGASDPAPPVQTFARQTEDLHRALTSLGESGPYLVVGHSFGGPQAVTFAARYRDEVTGVLLVDASPATWPATLCSVPDDGSAAATAFRQTCATISTPAANNEHLDGPAAFAEAAGVSTLGDLPVTVMTATRHPWGLAATESARLDEAWSIGQERWLALSPAARLVPVGDSGHDIQLDRPDAVVEEIVRLLP